MSNSTGIDPTIRMLSDRLNATLQRRETTFAGTAHRLVELKPRVWVRRGGIEPRRLVDNALVVWRVAGRSHADSWSGAHS
jgi:hypothetical protein